jgi:hypothetical protein
VDDLDTLLEVAVLLLNLLDDLSDGLGKLEDGELVRVSDVDGSGLVRVHEEDETVDKVVNVLHDCREGKGRSQVSVEEHKERKGRQGMADLERSSLLSVTVDGHVLTLESLDDAVKRTWNVRLRSRHLQR